MLLPPRCRGLCAKPACWVGVACSESRSEGSQGLARTKLNSEVLRTGTLGCKAFRCLEWQRGHIQFPR